LTNTTNDASASINNSGWYINLDSSTGSYNAERLITDPVASTNGWVFYTTFSPTNDICGFGGDSYVWMVNYNNGGTPNNVEGSLYIQLSTGAIKKVDLKQEFGSGHGQSGGRKLSYPLVGVPPPSQGMTLTLPPSPVNKVIHWEEK
jgi:type IV pilus assembly protein PilY1